MPAIIGNVNEISDGFLWRIGDIFTVTEREYFYYSPKFSFADNNWGLIIQRDYSLYINVWLRRISVDPPSKIEYSIILKTLDGKKDTEHCRSDVKEARLKDGCYRSISIPESFIRETERESSNEFAVFCTLKSPNSIGDKSTVATAQYSYCKETLDSENISAYEKKCMNIPDDVSLIEAYKKVLLNGKNHDLILKIGEKELRAHKDILRARSHIFESMLDHDMKEKRSGVIEVPDCDPQAMELFLSYVYCGKVETQDQNNIIGLYYIADKYDMQNLKEECSDIIRRSLSNKNICEIIQLALNHSDSRLLEYSTDYFRSNALDIMRTVEWHIFLKNNTTVGNELLIKSFEKKNCNIVSHESLSSDMSRGPQEDSDYAFKVCQNSRSYIKLCPESKTPVEKATGDDNMTCRTSFTLFLLALSIYIFIKYGCLQSL